MIFSHSSVFPFQSIVQARRIAEEHDTICQEFRKRQHAMILLISCVFPFQFILQRMRIVGEQDTIGQEFVFIYTHTHMCVQPVPEKMNLEMIIGMQNKILDGHHRYLFKRLI